MKYPNSYVLDGGATSITIGYLPPEERVRHFPNRRELRYEPSYNPPGGQGPNYFGPPQAQRDCFLADGTTRPSYDAYDRTMHFWNPITGTRSSR